MQIHETSSIPYWTFIEYGCSFEWPEASSEEKVYFREIATAFLRATFDVPEGYVIDVLETQHYQSRFPVISLGWNCEPEPMSLKDRCEFIRRMEEPLDRFVRAVDWQEVGRIRAESIHASG